MAFRKFTEYGAASRSEITIRTNDLLFISSSSLKRFNAEDAEYVSIFIDEDNNKIGLKFLNSKPDDDFRRISKEKSGRSVNIAPILRYLGIKKLDKKFSVDIEEVEGMLVFSVDALINKKAMN